MELRNLTTTPNQLEGMMQRRPSLSSLSSTSGYSSSNYGGNTTPQLSKNRLNTRKGFSGNTNSAWALSLQGTNTGSVSGKDQLVSSVGPWVEDQKAQQRAGVSVLNSLDSSALPENLEKIEKSVNESNENGISNLVKTKDESKDYNSNDDADRSNSNDINNENNDNDDDELIPTAIVIKNIPFAIKKEQLLEVMTKLNLPLPYAFNYHFDNGVFRGLAFANFTSTDETTLVVNQLNGREIGGRKLRVEYKKMLPLQERERIEREKREKRGQLEEQHRSTSNASLASLLSATSTTAATKNLSVNGNNSQTERIYVNFPNPSSIQVPPAELNFNDPEILELYTQLILYRDDISKSIFELAFASNLSIGHRKILSILCSYLGLLELYDNGLIIVRRRPGYQNYNSISQMVNSNNNQGSASMMNLSQLGGGIISSNSTNIGTPAHPELLRSQSQSALQLPRLRQQASTPVQQSSSASVNANNQGQIQQQTRSLYNQNLFNFQNSTNQSTSQNQSSNQGVSSSSAAALLRNSTNRSYVDVRSSVPLHNGFQQQVGSESPTTSYNFLGKNANSNQLSQPTTPLNSDINSRFAPFSQSNNFQNTFQVYQPNPTNQSSSNLNEDFSKANQDSLVSKLNSISLINNYDGPTNSNSGIWGTNRS